MTIEKTTHFQNDLKRLFEKYRISGGICLFVHNDTLHPVEAHGTEKHHYVEAIMSALVESLKATYPDIPFVDFNNTQNN